jgi:hypothetical protein
MFDDGALRFLPVSSQAGSGFSHSQEVAMGTRSGWSPLWLLTLGLFGCVDSTDPMGIQETVPAQDLDFFVPLSHPVEGAASTSSATVMSLDEFRTLSGGGEIPPEYLIPARISNPRMNVVAGASAFAAFAGADAYGTHAGVNALLNLRYEVSPLVEVQGTNGWAGVFPRNGELEVYMHGQVPGHCGHQANGHANFEAKVEWTLVHTVKVSEVRDFAADDAMQPSCRSTGGGGGGPPSGSGNHCVIQYWYDKATGEIVHWIVLYCYSVT